ncbi:MAG: hypothetical protein A3G75_07035 [Verrucomicrobia bacterium RIFCSPLOWO2_12_FULL_64_8]|nr:MAG: hypothetical protein A3G75_07035 [Verrucomicrobia bacterium RIFCSPLOWO2_12_FULL_64_8]
MDSTPPQQIRPATRALAAIVFTDVVKFSARMQENEVKTLKLLRRDFDFMREQATKNQGSVLKTTGDGLLLYFTSAVQAVRCALKVQRYFAEQAKVLPEEDVLVHRVGIHLGDVFVTAKDVMGDGVNIASRIQAEAEPGGVCISQTVYDVVKNKLALKATNLGARDLKNISESMPVYRILLEAQALDSSEAPFSAAPAPGSAAPLPSSAAPMLPKLDAGTRRRLVIGGAVLVAILILTVATLTIVRRARPPAVAGQTTPPAAAGSAVVVSDETELAQEFAKRRELLLQSRAQYLDRYDFAGLVQAIKDQSGAEPGRGAQLLLRSLEQLTSLKEWLNVRLRQNYSRQQPLRVLELVGDKPKETGVFIGMDRRVYFVQGGAVRVSEWADLKPAMVGAIMVSALRDVPPRDASTLVPGALIFARLYDLPQMLEPLQELRRSRPLRKP